MKTTLDLPDDLIREVKMRAVVQGRTVKDLVTEYLRQSLGMTSRESAGSHASSPLVNIEADGLPVIRCTPDAPATKMSVEDLLRIEQEAQLGEDLQRAGITV